MRVTDLDDESREALQVPASLQGALIAEIDPDSDAYRAGLRQGYVIEEIDRKPVKNAAEATALSQGASKEKPVLLRAWGEGQSRYFTLGGK